MPRLRDARSMSGLILTLALGACTASSVSSQPRTPQPTLNPGTFGGQHLKLDVSSTGAELEFDCGTASVKAPIALKADGTFAASGTFTREGPGPTRAGGATGQPMRITGSVKDDTIQVRIVLTDTDMEVGTFSVTRGTPARLVKCR